MLRHLATLFIISAALMAGVTPICAAEPGDTDTHVVHKPSKAVIKEAKKEAKKYAAEGWKARGSGHNLDSLFIAYFDLRQTAGNIEADHLFGYGEGKATNMDRSQLLAESAARAEIGSLMEAVAEERIQTYIKTSVQGGSPEDHMKITANSKTKVRTLLRKTTTLIELYRELPDGTCHTAIWAALELPDMDELISSSIDSH